MASWQSWPEGPRSEAHHAGRRRALGDGTTFRAESSTRRRTMSRARGLGAIRSRVGTGGPLHFVAFDLARLAGRALSSCSLLVHGSLARLRAERGLTRAPTCRRWLARVATRAPSPPASRPRTARRRRRARDR